MRVFSVKVTKKLYDFSTKKNAYKLKKNVHYYYVNRVDKKDDNVHKILYLI